MSQSHYKGIVQDLFIDTGVMFEEDYRGQKVAVTLDTIQVNISQLGAGYGEGGADSGGQGTLQ